MCLFHFSFFFFNDTATTEIYTLSLHDALPILPVAHLGRRSGGVRPDVGSALLLGHSHPHQSAVLLGGGDEAGRSEEHTSELQSQSNLVCRLLLEKKKKKTQQKTKKKVRAKKLT